MGYCVAYRTRRGTWARITLPGFKPMNLEDAKTWVAQMTYDCTDAVIEEFREGDVVPSGEPNAAKV